MANITNRDWWIANTTGQPLKVRCLSHNVVLGTARVVTMDGEYGEVDARALYPRSGGRYCVEPERRNRGGKMKNTIHDRREQMFLRQLETMQQQWFRRVQSAATDFAYSRIRESPLWPTLSNAEWDAAAEELGGEIEALIDAWIERKK